jgi:SAM-dependent methyltransferase/GNAT superfamily N-acetyltransferase
MTDDMKLRVGDGDADLDARLDAELTAFNLRATGTAGMDEFSARIDDPAGDLAAGLSGWTWGDCAGISMLWVHEDHRGRGLGTRLLDAAEVEARRRGCDRVLVSSFTFQAPEFYRRHGYLETARWPGFPGGAADVHFTKYITAHGEVAGSLIESYDDAAASMRDGFTKEPWKIEERATFLTRLRAEGATSLVEIGAGPGADSAFFAEQGLRVTATDLAPAMVDRCRAKGLDAHVMDVLRLDLPAGSYDAAYSLNCLLHVPNADLPAALAAIRSVLRPGGLFFLGLFGGVDSEGTHDEDNHVPPRFFAHRSDEIITSFVRPDFEIIDFHTRPIDRHTFQSLTLRSRFRR